MQNKTKALGGATIALALALTGGFALTAGALAPAQTGQVQQATPGATDTETADATTGTGAESATESTTDSATDTDNVQEGAGNQTENTADDINGVAVEDGTTN